MGYVTDSFKDAIKETELFEEPVMEATSSVRKGFDPAKHAKKLMNHEAWYKNHYSYGVKAAQKRKDKGTYDKELGKKAGFNLSRLGDSRLGTKLNAAEHHDPDEKPTKHSPRDLQLKVLKHEIKKRNLEIKKRSLNTEETELDEADNYKVSGKKMNGQGGNPSVSDEREMVKRGILPGGEENKGYERHALGKRGMRVSTRRRKVLDRTPNKAHGPNEKSFVNRSGAGPDDSMGYYHGRNEETMPGLESFLDESNILSSRIQDKLDALRAAKKKDDYDFSDFESADDKRKKAGGVKVVGTYGKTHSETDDEETPVAKAATPEQPVKRGRGRPRKYPVSTEPQVKRPRGRPRKNP